MALLIVLATFVTGIAALVAYYLLCVVQKPKLYVGNQELRKVLEKGLDILNEKYWPSPLFWGGRLQTILGMSMLRRAKKIAYNRELFALKDGGEIALDFAEADKPVDGEPLRVMFFPGLVSSSQSAYVRTLVTTLNNIGVSVVVFNYRGIGGVPFKTARSYTACDPEDAMEVCEHLRKRYPGERLIAVGTSLGAILLGKYLVTQPKDAAETFESAVLISIPWDCNAGVTNMESFINLHLINRAMAMSMVNLAKKFFKSMTELGLPIKFDQKAVRNSTTIREFHTNWTIPEFGYKDAVDYYNCCTVKGLCHKLPIPVIALNAVDDPLTPDGTLPIDEAEAAGSKLALITTSYGGHLGFLEGVKKVPAHFTERFMAQLFTTLRKNKRLI